MNYATWNKLTQELTRKLNAGEITEAEFDAQLKKLFDKLEAKIRAAKKK